MNDRDIGQSNVYCWSIDDSLDARVTIVLGREARLFYLLLEVTWPTEKSLNLEDSHDLGDHLANWGSIGWS